MFVYIQMYYIGVEARGFLFGPSIALAIGAKFIPLRKPGKLPGFFTALSVLVIVIEKLLRF
jgi:adenine/guanine phosphoribosyltransferase-like PRPP-binding protein